MENETEKQTTKNTDYIEIAAEKVARLFLSQIEENNATKKNEK